MRRSGFSDLKRDVLAIDLDERVCEEPAVIVCFRGTQAAAGTCHGNIRDAIEREMHHLVNVAGDYVLDAIALGKLVQGKIWIL